jgi:hypothetical protein
MDTNCTATISFGFTHTILNADFAINYDTCGRTAIFTDLSTFVTNCHNYKDILWEVLNPNNAVIATSNDSLFTYIFPEPNDSNPVEYLVRLSAEICGCSKTYKWKEERNITVYPTPKVKINGDEQMCEGDSAYLKAVPIKGKFVNHKWSWIDTNGTTQTVIDDSLKIYKSGIYMLESKDSIGCSFARDTFIVISPKLIMNVKVTDVSCYGDSTGIFEHGPVSGGTPPYFPFYWLFPKESGGYDTMFASPAGYRFINLKAGIYICKRIDSKACVLHGKVEVKQNDSLKIESEQFPATAGSNDGRLKLAASGGVPPYKFRIEKEDGTQVSTFNTATNLIAGIYRITVIDAVNCVTSDTISVLEKTVGVSEIISGKSSIIVHPNPTTGKITITGFPISDMRLSDSRTSEIEIYDIVGSNVGTYRIHTENTEIEIDISHLANGMYYLKISGEENIVIKIIKE